VDERILGRSDRNYRDSGYHRYAMSSECPMNPGPLKEAYKGVLGHKSRQVESKNFPYYEVHLKSFF
jgi:hypothetical protein